MGGLWGDWLGTDQKPAKKRRSLMATKRSIPDDEVLAGELLKEFLITRGHQIVSWDRSDDPPDLVFQIDGQRWAVEVTRVDARVDDRGKNKSRYDVDIKLLKFGMKLKGETDGQRRCDSNQCPARS